MGFNSVFKELKFVKNPGNERLNNLNDPVLNVLTWLRFFLPWLRFFRCFFLSCKANARVKLAKTRHGQHSSTLVVICVVRLLYVLFYVLFVCKCVLPPGDNQIAVNKYIISNYSDQTLTFTSHSKKNSGSCPSNQVSAVAMTSASDEKLRTFNCFFSRVGLRTYQQPCSN